MHNLPSSLCRVSHSSKRLSSVLKLYRVIAALDKAVYSGSDRSFCIVICSPVIYHVFSNEAAAGLCNGFLDKWASAFTQQVTRKIKNMTFVSMKVSAFDSTTLFIDKKRISFVILNSYLI